ncbi:MAG: aromatic-ring-hydroxylating dioxygenase subunit beta [Porticoccaceae bacterium]
MSGVSVDLIAQVDALQAQYIRALDNRDFQGWVDTFDTAEDTAYFCTPAENVDNNLEIALMYDDCRKRIEDRVTFITDIWAGTFQDYRTRHFIQRTHCEQKQEGLYLVETNFSIIYTPESGRSDVQVAGVYKDEVLINGGGAKFKSKKAIYDTTVLPRYIVYPF